MRSNKRIATLAQTSLLMGVLAAGMMRAPAFAQSSRVDNADWPLLSSEIHWPAGQGTSSIEHLHENLQSSMLQISSGVIAQLDSIAGGQGQ
jgi:hypothetical protein